MKRKERLICIGISALFGISYIYLSFLVDKDVFRAIDYEIMIRWQNSISHIFDLPFSTLTLLGSSEITLLILIIIFTAVLIVKRHMFFGLLLYPVIFIIELVGKLLIYHPAPPITLNRYVLDFHLPSSFVVHTDFSYPSGHMARISFLSIILLFLLWIMKNSLTRKLALAVMIFTFVLITFISRVYLGEHWLSDVVGGLILGSGIATLAISFW
jgi:membrane-associated phospholipid phosphatase